MSISAQRIETPVELPPPPPPTVEIQLTMDAETARTLKYLVHSARFLSEKPLSPAVNDALNRIFEELQRGGKVYFEDSTNPFQADR